MRLSSRASKPTTFPLSQLEDRLIFGPSLFACQGLPQDDFQRSPILLDLSEAGFVEMIVVASGLLGAIDCKIRMSDQISAGYAMLGALARRIDAPIWIFDRPMW